MYSNGISFEKILFKRGCKCRNCNKKLKYNTEKVIQFKSIIGNSHTVYICEECAKIIKDLIKEEA